MVIADDDRLDGRYLEVHQGILSLLARQAPVAGDLRLVAALLHVIKHIERMGDQCVNICQADPAVRPRAAGAPASCSTLLLRMGALAREEVTQCRRAFATRDVELAEDLVRQDREINRINRDIFRLAIEIGDDPDTREWAMTMIARRARAGARRRQRRRHRRAGRVRRDRPVPRVLRLLARPAPPMRPQIGHAVRKYRAAAVNDPVTRRTASLAHPPSPTLRRR